MRPTGVGLALVAFFLPAIAAAQTEPAPPPSAAPSTGAPSGAPPPQYYQEPPQGQGQPPPQYTYEPPPPGYGYGPQAIYEPPPPPKPRHRAPKYAFFAGARIGYFIPFGNLWLRENPPNSREYDQVKWSHFASSGPMYEFDIGARLGRAYNLFFLWERSELGAGSESPNAIFGDQVDADSDYYALGLRFSSDPDRVGFLTEIALGARRFRAKWDDGTELQMTEAPLEFRLGLGADIRVSPVFTISPMVTLGLGAFGSAEWVDPDGNKTDATASGDEAAGHGWVTFQIGGHFDLPGGDGD
jgi:hypothetical protein